MLAEQRAKMMADDFDYQNVMNAWDNHNIRNYATEKTKEIGKWARENPDYRYNPEKQVIYRNLLRDLKDNEHLNNGLLVDANIKSMNQWLNDPKNADVKDDEIVMQKKNELANYLKTGSIDGNSANRKLFTWEPPEEKVDLTPYFKMYGEATAHSNLQQKYGPRGMGWYWSAATDSDVANSAKSMVQNGAPQLKKWLNKYYKEYLSQNPDSKLTLEQYAGQQIKPFVKEDQYKTFSYNPESDGSVSTGNGRRVKPQAISELKEVASEAIRRKRPVQASADGLHQYFVGNKGALNTDGSHILSANGNSLPFNGGMLKDYSFSGSTVRAIPVGNNKYRFMATFKAKVPISEFDNIISKDIIDETNWFGLGMSNPEVRTKYKDLPIKITKDDDGKDVVEVELSKDIDYNNLSSHYAYNFGAHRKQEESSSEEYQPKKYAYSDIVKQYGPEKAAAYAEANPDMVDTSK